MRDYICDDFFYSKPYVAAETVPVANTLHQDAFLRDLIHCTAVSFSVHFHEFEYVVFIDWFEFHKFEFFNKLHELLWSFYAFLKIDFSDSN